MPITEMAAGTRRPGSRAARIVPIALSSDAATTAVGREARDRHIVDAEGANARQRPADTDDGLAEGEKAGEF